MIGNGNDKYNGKIFTKKKWNRTSNDNYIGLQMNLMGYPAEQNDIHGLVIKFHGMSYQSVLIDSILTPNIIKT